jgi:hypothetical protein
LPANGSEEEIAMRAHHVQGSNEVTNVPSVRRHGEVDVILSSNIKGTITRFENGGVEVKIANVPSRGQLSFRIDFPAYESGFESAGKESASGVESAPMSPTAFVRNIVESFTDEGRISSFKMTANGNTLRIWPEEC